MRRCRRRGNRERNHGKNSNTALPSAPISGLDCFMINVTLRPATADDAERLFDWRNDPDTRANSGDTREIDWPEHVAWLNRALSDPARRIFIVEAVGRPVGTIRADRRNDIWELSWTVAPEARGRGFGRTMVRTLIGRLSGTIHARVRRENGPSRRIAEAAGMIQERDDPEMIYFVAVRPDDG